MLNAWLIVLAKSGPLDLLLDPARDLLLSEAVAREVCKGPAGDPAPLAVEAGFAGSPPVVQVHGDVLKWGLGNGESDVLNLARARRAIAHACGMG